MVTLQGAIKDSTGNLLAGKLFVTLPGNMVDTSTVPDTVYTPFTSAFTISNTALTTTGVTGFTGNLYIQIPASISSSISYHFQFFTLDTTGAILDTPLVDFFAVIPNVSPVEWASLVPTGMVNDALDTGALRIARLIAGDTSLSSVIGGPFPQGAWNFSTTYKYRDMVSYLNSVYICASVNPIQGIVPTDPTNWMYIPTNPTGTVTIGDATAFSGAWIGSSLAPNQDAVYSALATKANSASPTLTGTVAVPTPSSGDVSTKPATTAFVNSYYAPLSNPSFTGNLSVSGSLSVGGTTLPLAVNSGFKNLIINPGFNINQRGTTFSFASAVQTLDRWLYGSSGGTGGTIATGTISQQAFTLGQTAVPGEPANYIRFTNTNTGTSLGSGSFHAIAQRINSVRTLAGQTCTVSFYAQSSISGKKIGVCLSQNFGTGTGQSAQVNITGTVFTLTSTFTKYTATFTLPSISGKTLGSTGGDYLALLFYIQADTSLDSTTGATGGISWSSTGTIDIAAVQLEAGSQATGFEYRSPQQELDMCQYYYQRIGVTNRFAALAGGQEGDTSLIFRNMRANPTSTLVSTVTRNNVSSAVLAIFSSSTGRFYIAATSGSTSSPVDTYAINDIYSLDAEL